MSDVIIERVAAYGAACLRSGEYAVVIVECDEPDFIVDPSEPKFTTWHDANMRAVEKNASIGLGVEEAWTRVSSSMAASRMLGKHWAPRGT